MWRHKNANVHTTGTIEKFPSVLFWPQIALGQEVRSVYSQRMRKKYKQAPLPKGYVHSLGTPLHGILEKCFKKSCRSHGKT